MITGVEVFSLDGDRGTIIVGEKYDSGVVEEILEDTEHPIPGIIVKTELEEYHFRGFTYLIVKRR